MIYVPGQGNSSAKLMVIGEAPGEHEERQGKPFVGPSGKILDEMLQKAGTSREAVYVTNVVKVRPPQNKIQRLKEIGKSIDEFLPQLFDEITAIRPNCILALGNTPLNALTDKSGITNYRGSILFSQKSGVKIVPTIHPAYLLHQKGEGGQFKYSTRAYIQLDVKRAVEESQFKELKLPERNIQIIKNSYDLYRFLQKFENHKRFALDIETVKSIPVCLGIAPSPNYAISIQLINVEGAGYEIPYHELAEMWKLLDEFLRSKKEWIGQNWKFDQQKLETVGFRMEDIYADTMLLASVVNPEFPKSLAFLGSVYSMEPFYKNEGKEFILGKDPINQLFLYNGKDACVTFEVFQNIYNDCVEYGLESFYFDFENKLHQFYLNLESAGLKVDFDVWKELLEKYTSLYKTKQVELESIAGYDLNVASPKQVFQYITKDLHLPTRSGTGEDILVQLLANHAKERKQIDSINLILEIRRIRKTIGTYLSSYPDFDGRMRCGYKISGTETGRTSTQKLDPPLRAVKGFGQPFQVFTKHGDIGSDIRRMYVADEGCYFFECDLSQAEARVVALLSNDDKTLELFDTTDIHTLTASWLFGVKIENVTKEMRFIGKTVRHAGNYGMGKRRLMLEVNSGARRAGIEINLSESKAGKILDVFHARAPKIRGTFHVEIQRELRNTNRVLRNPFGRRRQFFDRWGDDLFKEAYAFIPQSTVGDHLKMAGLRIKNRKRSIMFVLESHDSFLAIVKEAEIEETARIFKEEFEKEIDFSGCSIKRGKLVIPCEMKIGKNYKDLEKYDYQRAS